MAALIALSCWAGDDAEKSARAHVAASQQLFNLGKFAEALKELELAYQLKPAPGIQFNIAQCHRQLKDYPRAAFFFRAYAEGAGSPEQAAVARGLAKEMDDEAAKAESAEQERRAAEEGRATEQKRREQELAAELARLAAQKNGAAAEPPPPLYKRGWFWVAVGGVVAVGAGTAAALAVTAPRPRATSLGEVSLR